MRPLCLRAWYEMITAHCFHTALSPPWAFWRRTNINARTKHLSVFSDSVKCKTRRRDLGKRERLMACGKWRGETWETERGDQNRVSFSFFFFFFYCRIVKREENWEAWWLFENEGRDGQVKEWLCKMSQSVDFGRKMTAFGEHDDDDEREQLI